MSSTSLEKHRSSDKAIGETFEEASTNSDTAAEKAVLRRVDRHILPFIALIYLFSFLDR